MSELVERLRNPMWAHGNVPFESPQLEQEENIAAMNEAADRIETLEEQLASARAQVVIANQSNGFLLLAETRIEALEKALREIDTHLDNFGYLPNMKARRIARTALAP